MEGKNLFKIAKENSEYKICDGCKERKLIIEFKNKNKWCTNCPELLKIREKFKNKPLDNSNNIEDIDIDELFKNM